MPCTMGCFHEINILRYRQWGSPPHPFTPCQTPEKGSSSKHGKPQQKQKSFWGLWSWDLPI
ncbi:hypothetical protein I79_018810 [Cricetulus griseus]|uniref:Uncharacterized protein n=1 Tax=Cricetulus griseus TaxID=10029 RepID=G3I5Q5_CRIGR|nr:hypothetical protein I79_018810 [Cricetulus griseus]